MGADAGQMMVDERAPADLSACDREPIHQLGAIQPFGFLIAVSDDWRIMRVSDNVVRHVDRTPDQLLGMPASDLFTPEALHTLRNRLSQIAGPDTVERVFGVALLIGQPDRCFDCAIHRAGDMVIVEAEPSTPAVPSEAAGLVRGMMTRLDVARDFPAFFEQGARQIQGLTGFDRVMVYRFHEDGSGDVVAEVARGGVGSLMGLRYPASDIPVQARALYLRTPFRIIADVADAPARIVAGRNGDGAPLDLSLSVLRAVSAVHIEYLRNMGVAASLSISIIVEGRLWGLFACHHYRPRCPPFEARTLAELFGQMFAMKLESRERLAAAAVTEMARATADRLMAGVAANVGRLNDPEWIAATIGSIIPCDGVGIRLNEQIARAGTTPDGATLHLLADWLGQHASGAVFATDRLGDISPGISDASGVAGMLAIPLSRGKRDHIMLFRREEARTVTWAGNPEKAPAAATGRLSPRQSFAAWREAVNGRSAPFLPAERQIAETLRASLVDILRDLAEAATTERQRAAERQEVLIAELNHRVRNILALIGSLVRQSHDPQADTATFIDMLNGRIQALARAHDQITMDNWGPARLRPLIEAAGASHAGAGRLRLIGDPVQLDPLAISTLALVLHELMTNSSKHGALSGDGKVDVEWAIDASGGLEMRWREYDGPPVRPAQRQGLGTTIIERSIPYDLGGTATVDYAPTGFRAHFTIPASHIHRVDAEPPAIPADPSPAAEAPEEGARLLTGDILLVEDSLLIALHVQDMLLRLGASTVTTASGVAEALESLDRQRPAMAILDINLGRETSVPIADRLRADGVPYIFATGYGDQAKLPPDHRGITILQKPYTIANLAAALGAPQLIAAAPPGRG